jgi:hypothetical protein
VPRERFQDHLPAGRASGDRPVDARSGKFEQLTETRAWNFQQGAMLHWHRCARTAKLFNDARATKSWDRLRCDERKETTSATRDQRPRRQGRYALSLTYGRLPAPACRGLPRVGPEPWRAAPGQRRRVRHRPGDGRGAPGCFIREVYQILCKHPYLKDRHMWFNHTVFNKTDTRFLFLARI